MMRVQAAIAASPLLLSQISTSFGWACAKAGGANSAVARHVMRTARIGMMKAPFGKRHSLTGFMVAFWRRLRRGHDEGWGKPTLRPPRLTYFGTGPPISALTSVALDKIR